MQYTSISQTIFALYILTTYICYKYSMCKFNITGHQETKENHHQVHCLLVCCGYNNDYNEKGKNIKLHMYHVSSMANSVVIPSFYYSDPAS